MRTAIVWATERRVMVISYRRFGTNSQSHFKGLVVPKLLIRNYHYSLRNKPEECSSQVYIIYTLSYASGYFNIYWHFKTYRTINLLPFC